MSKSRLVSQFSYPYNIMGRLFIVDVDLYATYHDICVREVGYELPHRIVSFKNSRSRSFIHNELMYNVYVSLIDVLEHI